MPVSDAQRKSQKKYDKKNYTYYSIKLRNDNKLLFDKFCELKGYSKNGYATSAIFEKIERETGKTIEELKKDFEKIDNPTSIDDIDVLEEYTFKDKGSEIKNKDIER